MPRTPKKDRYMRNSSLFAKSVTALSLTSVMALAAVSAASAGAPSQPLLIQQTPLTGGVQGGFGTITFTVDGSEGVVYEISGDRSFRKGFSPATKGETQLWKVATTKPRTGKVGKTKMWIRESENRAATTQFVEMLWDFSPPSVAWGTSHAVYVLDKPIKNSWVAQIKALDVSLPNPDRGLRVQYSTSTPAPSNLDPFPADLSKFVLEYTSAPFRYSSALPVRWARVQDNFGNVSKWKRLSSWPYPPTG
jgi:hypothetical protein